MYKRENFVSVGEDIGEIAYLTYDEIKSKLRKKVQNPDFLAPVIRRFRDEVNIGDYVICTSPESIYFLLGEIIGDVIYNPDLSSRYQYTCYRRSVKWISKIYRNDLSDAAKRALSPQITVFKVKEQWQNEIFDNSVSLDFTPNDGIGLNRKNDSSEGNINSNNDDYGAVSMDNSNHIIAKYELKKEALRLEKSNVDQAISFYNDLINDELFSDDYYPYKRLTVCHHKKKDFQSEAEVIRDFFKSGIPCNKYQFFSFKYKFKKLVKRTHFTYSELNKLVNYFLENTYKFNYDEDLKYAPAERIVTKSAQIEIISEDEMIRRYKKGFLEAIADGLYREKLNGEAYDLYIKMIYEYKYISFRYYQRLCSIYRRTKNYSHELMVIREYFEENSIKKSKHNKNWFMERLESTKELINDDELVDSILNSKYERASHLMSDFKLNEMDSYNPKEIDEFKSAEFDNVDEDVKNKYKLKVDARSLEDSDVDEAISVYRGFITNPLFANDYYPYRRLVQLYPRINDYEGQCNIIKFFFKSGIYCNRHQYLWFRNKLRRLVVKDLITEDEIGELERTFNENGSKNKELSNSPVVIADRIRSKKGIVYVQTEEKYDNDEKTWELEEIASEYKRQEKFDDAIEVFEKMVYDDNYRSYRYLDELYRLYVKQEDYDKALDVIKRYCGGHSTHTSKSDSIFEKHIAEIDSILNLSDEELLGIILNDERDSGYSENNSPIIRGAKPNSQLSISKKLNNENHNEIKATGSEKLSIANTLGVQNEFSHILSIMEEYDIDLDEPLNIYTFDEALSERENINRKFYLMEYARAVNSMKLYDHLINIYKIYTENNYFKNDCYPYRQLCITYKKTKDYDAALDKIRDLFLSGTYLNNYQYTWFTNKIRLLKERIQIDEEQVQSWLDFYDQNGAKNKDKLNSPAVLADRMKRIDDKIYVMSEEAFDLTQETYYFFEKGRILENKGQYEMAILYYEEKLADYPLEKFYQRICMCLEKLKDFKRELDWIRNFYNDTSVYASDEMEDWFLKRLKKVNSKLGTDYNVEDLR